MTLMTILLTIWGVLTTILIVLLIYRSTLTMHEDDQLFLDEAEHHMQTEQIELLHRMNRLTPYLRFCGIASGLLIIAMVGLALYDKLNQSW